MQRRIATIVAAMVSNTTNNNIIVILVIKIIKITTPTQVVIITCTQGVALNEARTIVVVVQLNIIIIIIKGHPSNLLIKTCLSHQPRPVAHLRKEQNSSRLLIQTSSLEN